MKYKNWILLTLITGIFGFASCDKDDINSINCDKQVVISADEYKTSPNDQLAINSLELNEDCLKINFRSGGCNGDTWELKLIDSGVLLYSDPPQRNLKLSLKNEELLKQLSQKNLLLI